MTETLIVVLRDLQVLQFGGTVSLYSSLACLLGMSIGSIGVHLQFCIKTLMLCKFVGTTGFHVVHYFLLGHILIGGLRCSIWFCVNTCKCSS